MNPLAENAGVAVYHDDWRALLDVVPACDLLCVDAPYSERTHSGHGTVERWGPESKGLPPTYDDGERRAIPYAAWTPADVDVFVAAWSPRCTGWFISITDHVLASAWEAALEATGRYVFAPLPYVASGSRVRLTGDGPSNWTCWIVVARPRTPEFLKWGTLRGAYVLPPGMKERMPVVGGKPLWLAQAIIEDYSRPGDLVVDPCCGAGGVAVAAIRTGRRAIVGDVLREHAELAALWVRHPERPAPSMESRPVPGQVAMFGARP